MSRNIVKELSEAIVENVPEGISIQFTRPEENFGDFATNIALQVAPKLGRQPREVALDFAQLLQQVEGVQSTTVAGPGFINVVLTDESLRVLAESEPAKMQSERVVIVEYSDPNPFKPLHAGHLYTTLVGDGISRLIESAGAKVIRLNYGGDVGLHVGKTMWAIIKHIQGENPEKLSEIAEDERPKWLGARYVEGNNAYEENEVDQQEIISINKRVYDLHAANDKDSNFAQIYWTCRRWSYDYFATLYDQLQVTPFDRYIPESEVTPLGLSTVQQHINDGIFNESDGAIIFDGEKYGLHKRVFINSKGLPTYETKDVGLSLTKWADYHFDESIIITANEQSQYMQVVLKAIEQIEPEPAKRTKHLTHGLVKLQGSVKMSSRKGNVVTAVEILESARAAGAAIRNNTDESVILAAVKYAFAKNRLGGDTVYDPKESVALEGNSGPYLQYAHARACSILVKGTATTGLEEAPLQPGERSLLRKVGEFAEVVELASSELMPHHICTYLYELAQVFNAFYEQNRVIGDEREAIRLSLIGHYVRVLKRGLGLLGISAPQKM